MYSIVFFIQFYNSGRFEIYVLTLLVCSSGKDDTVFKSTKMKFRPYYTMELVQKLMEKTSKYLIYSPLTEKVLTE